MKKKIKAKLDKVLNRKAKFAAPKEPKGTMTPEQKDELTVALGNLKHWNAETLKQDRNYKEAVLSIQLKEIEIEKLKEQAARFRQSLETSQSQAEGQLNRIVKVKEEVCAAHGLPVQDFQYDDASDSLEIVFSTTAE